jgi:hypothetical protein
MVLSQLSNSTPKGWFHPTTSRKWHFDNGDGRSLCGKWGRFGLGGGEAPIEFGAEAPKSIDDCATCRRKLEALKR